VPVGKSWLTPLLAPARFISPWSFAQDMKSQPASDTVLFDFVNATNAAWQSVNDDVMGGVSTSSFRVTNGVAVFRGKLSLENNGGFASVRSLPARLEWGDADSFLIRVRGDGRRYKFTARRDTSLDSAIYQAAFETKHDEREEHRLPLKAFVPSFRGRVLTEVPPLHANEVTSIGFLISDKQAGSFQLEIQWIKANWAPKE